MRNGVFRRANLQQRSLPSALELASDEPSVWVHLIELTFCKGRRVALSFKLTLGANAKGVIHLSLRATRPRQCVDFSRRKRRQERLRDHCVHPRRADVLASGQGLVGSQMIADILSAISIANVQLVATTPTPGNAMQE